MDQGRTVSLVTGGNRGIGLEVCRQLVEKGHQVILSARSYAKAEAAAQSLEGDVAPLQLDVDDPASIATAAQSVANHFGRLDALINNAAIDYDTDQQVLTADIARVGRVLHTNTLGPWRVAQAFLPLLELSAHGRIVNVSSQAGSWSALTGGTPAYTLSKMALNALTVMMANALKPKRILVNAICPGWVATEMGGSGGGPVPPGAASVVWGVMLPDDGPTGGFFRHGKPLDW